MFQLLGSIGLVNSKKRERIQLKTANSLMYTITNYLRGIIKDDDEFMVRLFNSKDELKEELNEAGWIVGDEILCKECYKYKK